MTTIAERMRAAADDFAACGTCSCDDCARTRIHVANIREAADAIEAVIREMQSGNQDDYILTLADRLRGETK